MPNRERMWWTLWDLCECVGGAEVVSAWEGRSLTWLWKPRSL